MKPSKGPFWSALGSRAHEVALIKSSSKAPGHDGQEHGGWNPRFYARHAVGKRWRWNLKKCCPHWQAGRKEKWRKFTYHEPARGWRSPRLSFLNSPVGGACPGNGGSERESAASKVR